MENKSLGNLVPIWHFDNDLIFYKDGSFGAGFKIQGKDLSCSSVDSINQYSRDLEQMINTCPEGLKIQFFFHLNSNCSGFIDNHRELSKTASNNYKAIADSRINFLSEANHNKEFYLPEINFFIRGQDNDLTKNNILQKESRFIEISKKEYQGNKEEFLKSVGQFYSSLKKIDSNARMLQKEEWFNLIFRFLNLSRLEKNEMPLLRNESNPFCPSLVEQITLTDLFVNKDSIKIGEYYFKAISLKTLPDGETFPTMGRSLLNLPFHFWLSQTIEVHDQKKEIDKLNLQRRFANSLATGSSKLRDLESESILTNLERLIEDLLQGSEKVVSMDTTVIVWSSDANDLERKADEVLKAFNSMNRSEGLIETYACLEAFLSAIPGNCKGFRQKKMKSSNAAHILVPYSSWLGNKSPVCLLPNREGVPFSLDPFASELPNWNGVVFGGSGSGKSFLICQLMLMFYGQIPNPKIVWIDNGASSQKLLEVLEGEFIDLRPSSGICLNMFDLPTGETKPDSAKVKLILAALENILKEDGQNGISKRSKAILEKCIYEIYEKISRPTLSDFNNLLKNHPEREINIFSQSLYSWTGNTAYGEMIDGKTNIDLSKDLVTIETRGLDDHPELQNIFMLLLTDRIKNDASLDSSRPYLLIIDEAWKLFQTPSGMMFALEAYRTFRKFKGGIWCISQNYKDFLSNQEIKNALLPNTANVFILKQRKIDWKDFKESMDFNHEEVEAIKSLEVIKGAYSEFFFLQDDNRAILRMTPDPLSYWICTSDGDDRAQIKDLELKRPNLSKIEILELLAFGKKEERILKIK